MNDSKALKIRAMLNDSVLFEEDIQRLVGEGDYTTQGETCNRVATGTIGELLVIKQLESRGIKSTRMVGGAPFDLLISDNNIPAEVKVAYKGFSRMKYKGKELRTESYAFNLPNHLSSITIIWLPEQDEYYIAPTKELRTGVNRIYPNAKRWAAYKNNWGMIKTTRITTIQSQLTINRKNGGIVHLNQAALVDRTGIPPSDISRYLSEQRVPNFKRAKQMADAMNVSLDKLYQILYQKV